MGGLLEVMGLSYPVLILPFLVLVVLVITGMIPGSKRHASDSVRIAVAGEVGLRVLFLLFFLGAVYWYIPRLKRVFEDFDVHPPVATRMTFVLSDLLHGPSAEWWMIGAALVTGLLLVLADALLYFRQFDAETGSHRTFSKVVTSASVLLFLGMTMSLWLPVVKLLNDLR